VRSSTWLAWHSSAMGGRGRGWAAAGGGLPHTPAAAPNIGATVLPGKDCATSDANCCVTVAAAVTRERVCAARTLFACSVRLVGSLKKQAGHFVRVGDKRAAPWAAWRRRSGGAAKAALTAAFRADSKAAKRDMGTYNAREGRGATSAS